MYFQVTVKSIWSVLSCPTFQGELCTKWNIDLFKIQLMSFLCPLSHAGKSHLIPNLQIDLSNVELMTSLCPVPPVAESHLIPISHWFDHIGKALPMSRGISASHSPGVSGRMRGAEQSRTCLQGWFTMGSISCKQFVAGLMQFESACIHITRAHKYHSSTRSDLGLVLI